MATTYLAGEQTKKLILEESKKLFFQKGYTKTTYNDIRDAAKVNRALIPYHFNNKQILAAAIYNDVMNEFYTLIDNILDASQFDADFLNTLHIIAYHRLLADNPSFSQFVFELLDAENTDLFDLSQESNRIAGLGNKFSNLSAEQLTLLTRLYIGMQKESIALLANDSDTTPTDQISSAEIHMLMQYVGYSSKKVDELVNAAVEVCNLLNIEILNDLSIRFTYN